MTLVSFISIFDILESSSVGILSSSSGDCSEILSPVGRTGSTDSFSLVEWSDVTDAVLAQLYSDPECFKS